MSELFQNPELVGVEKVLEWGGRSQAIPPHWTVVQRLIDDNNPASEIYNQNPSGSQVYVSNRKVDLRFTQTVNLPVGRYLLKTLIARHTTGGKETDLQYGLYLAMPSGAEFDYQNTSSIPSASSTGEQLTVFQLTSPATVNIGLKITTSYGSLDGFLLLQHIGLEPVDMNFGTPVIILGGFDASPSPTPPPAPPIPQVPTLPNTPPPSPVQPPPLPQHPTLPLPINPIQLPTLPFPPLEPLPGVAAWQYYEAMSLYFMQLANAAKPMEATSG